MNEDAFLALLWLVSATGLIASFAFFVCWLSDRAGRRRERHAAE